MPDNKKLLSLNYSESRMKEFRDTLKILPKALHGSINTPFIEFIIDKTKFATYENQNYFMQMSCKYAGVGSDGSLSGGGEANEFTIQLVYMPKPSQNPNYIDELLSGVTADQKLCSLRFGYSGVPGYNLISSIYDCIILGYTLTLQNNFFYYTIQCVSQGLIYRERRFNFPRAKEVDPINWIYECWSYCKIDRYYGLEIGEDVKGHVEKMDIGYNKNDEGDVVDNTSTLSDVTIFQFLDTILDNVTDTDSDQAIYWYELNDVKGKKTVIIHRTLVSSSKDLLNTSVFTFDWGGNHQDDSTNNLVLGFETSYDGSVNISISENLIENKYGIDSSGTEIAAPGYFEYFAPDNIRKEFSKDSKFWSKATTWKYTAQMELCGIPADIPIGAFVEVNPLIYGRKHHTAGVYMITGARCDISANGFRTNLDLMKVEISDDLASEQNSNSWWSKIKKQANWMIYTNSIAKARERYYINSSGVLSVRNDPNSSAGNLTFAGKDFVYIPTDPQENNKGPILTYSDYDNNIPVPRGD